MKRFLNIILSMSLMIVFAVNNVNAKDEMSENDFKDIVENSQYFIEYKEEIKNVDVLRKVNTEFGLRYTIQYTLNSDDLYSTLVFVGDQDGNIIEALQVKTFDEQIFMDDLIDDYTATVHTRGPVYKCVRYTCNQWETKIGYQPSPGCSGLVGMPCEGFRLLGHPIIAILCKVGVFVACNTTIDKVCTNYYEEIDVCSL